MTYFFVHEVKVMFFFKDLFLAFYAFISIGQ